jgi:hypothetical protein
MELRNTSSGESENNILVTNSSSNYQSARENSSSPNIELGCKDSCYKTVNVLTKQEEQEELLINLISKLENTKLRSKYLVKFTKLLTMEEPSKEKPSSHILVIVKL